MARGSPALPGQVPEISVIIPAFGVASLVVHALSSLQAQTHAGWEAIVVDDGDAAVAGAMSGFSSDPRIRLLKTENHGPSEARNRAVATARAPFVSFLDGDDTYQPNYIARMLLAVRDDAGFGFATCDARYFGVTDRSGMLFSSFNPQADPITLEAVLERRFNVFIASAVRRAAFEAVGGFDTDLVHAEDFDLWIRLLSAGYRAVLVPEPLVCYRRREGSLSTEGTKMLSGAARVYEKAVVSLAGRPELPAAARRLAILRTELEFAHGIELIRAGRVREGIVLLGHNTKRSLRWRLAIPILWCLPVLARPMLGMRPGLRAPRTP